MKYLFFFLAICLMNVVFAQSAKEIVQKAYEKMRGSTTVVELTIKIIRPTWTRAIDVKSWMKGNEFSMILIQWQCKNKGQQSLNKICHYTIA